MRERQSRIGFLAWQAQAFACHQTGKSQTAGDTGSLGGTATTQYYDPDRAKLQQELAQGMGGANNQSGSEAYGTNYGTQDNPYQPGPARNPGATYPNYTGSATAPNGGGPERPPTTTVDRGRPTGNTGGQSLNSPTADPRIMSADQAHNFALQDYYSKTAQQNSTNAAGGGPTGTNFGLYDPIYDPYSGKYQRTTTPHSNLSGWGGPNNAGFLEDPSGYSQAGLGISAPTDQQLSPYLSKYSTTSPYTPASVQGSQPQQAQQTSIAGPQMTAAAPPPEVPPDTTPPANPGELPVTPKPTPTPGGGTRGINRPAIPYEWGSGGAAGNRQAASGQTFQGYSNIANNPISQDTRNAMTQESLNAANAKTAGAGEQIQRNAAATGNQAGIAAAMAQLGRDRAGIGEQAGRENVIAQDTMATQRRMGALGGLSGLSGQQSADYNAMLAARGTLGGQSVGQSSNLSGGQKFRTNSSGSAFAI